MAKIASLFLDFDRPEGTAAASIVGFKIRVAPVGTEFNYDLPFTTISGAEETLSVDLSQIIEGDGEYTVFVTSYKDNGNESDPESIDVIVDFTPPPPPVNLRVR